MSSRKSIVLVATSVALAAGLGYGIRARAAGIPGANALSYAGVLEDAAGPINGTHNIQIIVYDAASGGNSLCQTASASLTVTNGRFSVRLPDTCTTAVGANPTAFVDVVVDGSDTGRAAIGAVPYAVEAKHAIAADTASGATHATNADTATNATHATNADTATNATSAGGALQSELVKRLGVLGLGSCLDGTCPPVATTPFVWQGGTSVVSLDGNGDTLITFTKPFSGGLVTTVAINGDATANGEAFNVVAGGTDRNGIHVHARGGANNLARVNWIAVGW